MKTLPKNWMTEGLIDFEYKKYQLLSYLQETNRQFGQVKLYPFLADLIEHHRQLEAFKYGKSKLADLFPKAISHVDLKNVKIHYQSPEYDNEVLQEINQIAEFALPRVEGKIKEGRSIFDFVEEQVEIEPIGIQPLYTKEGFVFLTQENSSDIFTYRYRSSLLQLAGERFRSLKMWFLGLFRKTLYRTMENLKLELIQQVKELPNPATWRVHSNYTVPLEETLLPLSKRLLLERIGK
ncbi:MAG: hypothetical protein ACQEW9_08955 [Bacteroidota bacterium]|uniref:Uncharacterized protein n=1 Tax=Algoriphagus faecimaris TaxID=686796 RepID=A0A1G6NFS9_9BACT|nr:hypothetical protein [Algoriphagus faecimaris]SDC66693.1 hypothetical protein SAMN04488104_1003114 [Algoriphagus faecimaris]